MANITMGQGACLAPFLQASNFPSNEGYVPGRMCRDTPTARGIVNCCLPCPISDWVYGDDFNQLSRVSNWLNVVGMVGAVLLLVSFIVLPVQKTGRHHLTIWLIVAICILQLGFIVPLGANPEQCHDAITPNDMRSDFTCAFSGACLLAGGFASIMWGFIRTVSLHLQICWKVVPGRKMFWCSLLAGWGVPALIAATALAVTGVSYRFGETCHINHEKALQDYWGPILFFAGVATILQFVTFGYCIRVYIKALMNDDPQSTSENNSGLPSYSGSVKTVTTRQAYQRVKKVISLHWRGIIVVLILIINVVFLSIVFVSMDNSVQAAMSHPNGAQDWLTCLVVHPTDKNACLSQVGDLVESEAVVMAVLIMMSLNGIWAILFLGRLSMIPAWIELLKRPFAKQSEFVSADARRFANETKNYEMITSPPSRAAETPREPPSAVVSPGSDSISTFSPSSKIDYFGKEAIYRSPSLSFSTPRPPSAGRNYGREWDPSSTHAKSTQGMTSFGKIYE